MLKKHPLDLADKSPLIWHHNHEIVKTALDYYIALVADVYHLKPETENDLDERLKDKV